MLVNIAIAFYLFTDSNQYSSVTSNNYQNKQIEWDLKVLNPDLLTIITVNLLILIEFQAFSKLQMYQTALVYIIFLLTIESTFSRILKINHSNSVKDLKQIIFVYQQTPH